ncbi:MAG: DUF2892 domain-containing protein [Chloroflexota bacterium]
MKLNEGTTDRYIRLMLALLIFTAGTVTDAWWGLVGIIPLVTGFIGWCPLYRILGLSTLPKQKIRRRV